MVGAAGHHNQVNIFQFDMDPKESFKYGSVVTGTSKITNLIKREKLIEFSTLKYPKNTAEFKNLGLSDNRMGYFFQKEDIQKTAF